MHEKIIERASEIIQERAAGHHNYCTLAINDTEWYPTTTTKSGTIEQITDPEVKKEMWYDGLKNHFSGYDDPNYCVLKFKTERYSLFIDWQEAKGSLT